MQEFVLRDLLAESKDGEWGERDLADGLVEMLVIRGTDFESVRVGDLSGVPRRFIPKRIADRKVLRPYDLLIETAGGSKDRPTGRTLLLKPEIFRKSVLPITCASFARFLRVDPARADAEYVFWLLQAMYESRQLLKYHTQHTGVARYQFTTFADNEPLVLPGVATQQRIASILSAYDDLIENNTRRIAILEEMARRIYEEWFVRFRFPGHETDQSSWQSVQLGEIAIIQTGPFGSQLHQSDYVDEGIPVTMPKDIALNRVDVSSIARIPEQLADQLGRHRMRSGDIVYGRRGDIGRKAFIGTRQEGWLCGTGCLLIRPNPEQVAPRFLFDALGAPETLGLIKGRAKGATMPNLSAGLMQSVPLSLPPRGLQDDYVRTITPMMELVENLTEKNRNLRATRDLLLPKLISGDLDVSTLPEPEEAIPA